MRLTELRPQFLKWIDDTHFRHADENGAPYSLGEADGIVFLCPVCFAASDRSSRGVHSVICWEPNVPQTTSPTPGRWNLVGSGLDDLSLVAGSSSILLTGEGCGAHFFITNGEIR